MNTFVKKKPNMSKALQKVANKYKVKKMFSGKTEKKIINKVVTKLDQQLAKAVKVNHISKSNYLYSLANPELSKGCRVPRQFGISTVPMWRHTTVQVAANATGYAMFLYNPFSLLDNTVAETSTTFGLQNNSAYDGSTTFTGNPIGIEMNYTITVATIQSYRLVSASMLIYPEISVLNMAGKIGGAVVPYAISEGTVGSAITSNTQIQTISNIETYDYYAEAQLSLLQALRLVWYPNDIHDFELYGVNVADQSSGGSTTDTIFLGYLSGVPASSKFNCEIYANYEVTPAPGSTLTGMTTPSTDLDDPGYEALLLKMHPEIIASAISSNGRVQLGKTSSQSGRISSQVLNENPMIPDYIKIQQQSNIAKGDPRRFY